MWFGMLVGPCAVVGPVANLLPTWGAGFGVLERGTPDVIETEDTHLNPCPQNQGR